MSDQESFIQHQQLLHQQQTAILSNMQENIQSPAPNAESILTNLRDIMSIIETRTNSIANHLHQANQFTSLSDAINMVQAQNQEAMRQQSNVITTMESLVQRLIDQVPPPAAAAASTSYVSVGRVQIPHPFTPSFNGDAKVLSFRAFRAKLNGVFQRFEKAFETDTQCVTYAIACMSGPPLEHFAPVYNNEVEDSDGILEHYETFMTALEEAYGDKLSIQEAEDKIRFLKQRGTMQEYVSEFSTLQSQVRWNQSALVSQFKWGLSEPVRNLLQSQWHQLTTMRAATEAATTAYQNLRLTTSRRPHGSQQQPWRPQNQPNRPAAPRPAPQPATPRPGPNDMELGAMRGPLSSEEKDRRRKENLCLYCGQPKHFASNCPNKRPPAMGLAVVQEATVDYSFDSDLGNGSA